MKYYFNYYKRFFESIYKKNRQRLGNYSRIGVIDTSIASSNLGDKIIMNSVFENIREVFPNSLISNYPSHLHRDYDAKLMMSNEDLLFVGGTNLLSSNMNKYYQWKIDSLDTVFFKKRVVLMGVGWWQYQNSPNRYTKNILKNILSDSYIHSVRDSYTLKMLKEIGIENVVNTSCPTMWNLDINQLKAISRHKARNVVATLTYYHENYELDSQILQLLQSNYEKVYLWAQGIQDLAYFYKLTVKIEGIIVLPPTLEALDSILLSDDIEYIGTRLHSGIRAIQLKIRTLIISVDNRAYEIGKDTGLNVIKREDINLIRKYISDDYQTQIFVPLEEINIWKKQFQNKTSL